MTDFGTCWSCIYDLTMPGVMVGGRLCIAQAIARRLQTPYGGLIDDPNYGYDLTGFVNEDIPANGIDQIQSGVKVECEKDERVLTADVTVALPASGILITTISVTTADGPFTLVLSTDEVTTSILRITQ